MQGNSNLVKHVLAMLLLGLVFSLVAQRAKAQYNAVQLHAFSSFNIKDGASPYASLTRDSQGNFYGTTWGGGVYGDGTVFEIDNQGNFSLLHSFNGSDGFFPQASVALDNQGNIYGTTGGGGAYDEGTVFKINNLHKFSLLHSFNNISTSDGYNPNGVTLDRHGNIFGTTGSGGTSDNGTVFKIDTLGNFSLIHSFNKNISADGDGPNNAVTIDSKGNIYGTTGAGGASDNGTIFKIDTLGNFSLVHSFNQNDSWFGSYSGGPIAIDSQGNLFGTMSQGGANGGGAVFKIDTSGYLSLVHSFSMFTSVDGEMPFWAFVPGQYG